MTDNKVKIIKAPESANNRNGFSAAKTVDLSPTVREGNELKKILPEEGTPCPEMVKVLHFNTESFSIFQRTIFLANGDENTKMISIADFYKAAMDDSSFNFSRLFNTDNKEIVDALLGGKLFVYFYSLSVNSDKTEIERKYLHMIVEFICFCEAAKKTKDSEIASKIFFVSYGPMPHLPELAKKKTRIIDYTDLKTADYRKLIKEYSNRNIAQVNLHKEPYMKDRPYIEEDSISDDVCDWYENWMSGLSEPEVRRIFTSLKEEAGSGFIDFCNDETVRLLLKRRIIKHKNEVLKINDKLKVKEDKPPKEDDRHKREKDKRRPNVEGMGTVSDYLDEQAKLIKKLKRSPAESLRPLGMLLVGIPGTGKSAAAQMAADKLNLPLVQLEMSKILGSYVGESEKNMELMFRDLVYASPCVLWIDEIEKALSGANGKSDGSGVVRRLFGMLLTFVQENKKIVFLAVTANDISSLPPEFFRNGRFDRTFCAMMPEYNGLIKILERKLLDAAEDLGWKKENLETGLLQSLLNECIGPKDSPKYLTGADIEAHVKELFVTYAIDGKKAFPKPVELVEDMKKAAQKVRAQVPGNSVYAVRDAAERYLAMLQRGMTLTGSDSSWFSPSKSVLDADAVRFIGDETKKEDLRCMRILDKEAFNRAVNDQTAANWYDAKLFETIVKAMNELIIYDEKYTPAGTRTQYYAWKVKVS